MSFDGSLYKNPSGAADSDARKIAIIRASCDTETAGTPVDLAQTLARNVNMNL